MGLPWKLSRDKPVHTYEHARAAPKGAAGRGSPAGALTRSTPPLRDSFFSAKHGRASCCTSLPEALAKVSEAQPGPQSRGASEGAAAGRARAAAEVQWAPAPTCQGQAGTMGEPGEPTFSSWRDAPSTRRLGEVRRGPFDAATLVGPNGQGCRVLIWYGQGRFLLTSAA
eukprot:CAMPEP_0195098612 /NCGR_PEP_ID=MMETSP0448-20130528/57774_1 /TAXON_ID=66468 /ORGANISM="Heterocapsa triquestra, Strain CCMP 448" /LENGTH=168 /DNA_ID=CAMNT_0040133345 /DNA_START=27 /DNA_END=532 /DNA_ORIENTATION=+